MFDRAGSNRAAPSDTIRPASLQLRTNEEEVAPRPCSVAKGKRPGRFLLVRTCPLTRAFPARAGEVCMRINSARDIAFDVFCNPNTLRTVVCRLLCLPSATQPVLPFHSDKAIAFFTGRRGGGREHACCVFLHRTCIVISGEELRNGDSPKRGRAGCARVTPSRGGSQA